MIKMIKYAIIGPKRINNRMLKRYVYAIVPTKKKAQEFILFAGIRATANIEEVQDRG